MGVADFAFSHCVSFRRKNPAGEATEIALESQGDILVAKNKSGRQLYNLTLEGNGEYSMRDNHGHAVLRTKQDPEKPHSFCLLDKEERIIGHTCGGTFQWERVSITWTAKSIGLIHDAVMLAYKDSDLPGSPKSSKEEALAELKLAHHKVPGCLKVHSAVNNSEALPPMGLFLFEAMVLNQGYLQAGALRRLSMTSSLMKR